MWGDVWLEVDEAPIDRVLMAVLSVSPFDESVRDVEWDHVDEWAGSEADWQITEVASAREGVWPLDVPRFISPAVERYLDQWYFAR